MPDRWSEERERRWRERHWRPEAYGRGDEERHARLWGEERTWAGPADEERGPPGARFEGSGRDRVFGERDTGAEYNRPRPGGGAYGAGGSYGAGEGYGRDAGRWETRSGAHRQGRPEWQDRDYTGVSPAMEQGEYQLERERRWPRFEAEDYTQGGRYYGDDRRMPIYREEYGQGGVDHGPAPRGYDAERNRYQRGRYEGRGRENRELEERYAREMRRPASGGTGGYDYERGYGEGGRWQERRTGGRPGWQDRDYGGPSPAEFRGGGYDVDRDRREGRGWEDRERYEARGRGERFEGQARAAGEFLQRAGERLSSWLGGLAGEGRGEERREGPRRYSADFGREPRWEVGGHRGRGPKDYKRSDERINDEVHQRLTEDPWLDASQISVSVSGGEVTLSGTVEDRESKHRAERLVEDLHGVGHVQNNLRIDRSFFTSPERGYGDSVMEAQMRGEGGGDGSAMSRSTTRRT